MKSFALQNWPGRPAIARAHRAAVQQIALARDSMFRVPLQLPGRNAALAPCRDAAPAGPNQQDRQLSLFPDAAKVRVLIATTLGPVDVLLLTPEDPVIGRSVACIGGTTRTADIDADYQAFVDRSTGVVERLFGSGCFRLDVSGRIDAGFSWQLGVLVAHALLDRGQLAQEGEAADVVLWTTGSVRAVDLAVGKVGHIPEKLALSLKRLQNERAAGRQVIVALPESCQGDVPAEILTALETAGARVLTASSADALVRLPHSGHEKQVNQLQATAVAATRLIRPGAALEATERKGLAAVTRHNDTQPGVPPAASLPTNRRVFASSMAAMFTLGLAGDQLIGAADRAALAAQVPFHSAKAPPLSQAMLASLRQELASAKQMLRRMSTQKMIEAPASPDNNMWAWVIAQMMAAAPPQDPDEKAAYLAYMDKTLNKDCGCFVVGAVQHAVTSAWALLSYARLGEAPPSAALEGVIGRQKVGGWWSATLDATDDERNAALYVTALMVLALNHLKQHSPLNADQAAAVCRAHKRGVDWLAQQNPDVSGEWADYPKNGRAQHHTMFGAMVLVATEGLGLAMTQKSTGDILWRSYKGLPQSHVFFPSDIMVKRATDAGYSDTYRHVPYPWVAYALAMSYEHRSLWDQVQIARDLRNALLVNLQSPVFRKQEWLLAEHVFVLDKLLSRLEQNVGKVEHTASK